MAISVEGHTILVDTPKRRCRRRLGIVILMFPSRNPCSITRWSLPCQSCGWLPAVSTRTVRVPNTGGSRRAAAEAIRAIRGRRRWRRGRRRPPRWAAMAAEGGDVVRRAGLRSGGNSSPDVFTFPRGGGGAAAAAPTDYRGGGGADSAESIVARAAASAESSPHRFPKLSIFWLTAVRTRFWEVTHAFVPGMRLLFSLNAAERRRGRTELLRASSRLEIRPMRASNARPTHATCEAQPKRITGDVVRCTFSRTWPKSAM